MTSWNEIRVTSWDDFDQEVEGLEYRKWVFRGQSDARWLLNTSLYRSFEDAIPIIPHKGGQGRVFARDTHEKLLIKRFKESAHLYRSSLPNAAKSLEWLAIMQHHGAPTRFLDVTLSPHIACYFALDSGHDDCCIFAFDHQRLHHPDRKVHDLLKDILKSRLKSPAFIVPYRPEMTTERLVAQQGLFLVPSNNHDSFSQIITAHAPDGSACKKIVIPAHMRFDGISRLRKMNLTSTALFPGIDGFCRSLRFQILESTRSQKLL